MSTRSVLARSNPLRLLSRFVSSLHSLADNMTLSDSDYEDSGLLPDYFLASGDSDFDWRVGPRMSSSPLSASPGPNALLLRPPRASAALLASVPPEILSHIFKLAHRPWDLKAKIKIALVCRRWWEASTLWDRYAVNTPKRAFRLAYWLEMSNRGDFVQTLELKFDGTWKKKAVDAVAYLLRVCRRVHCLTFRFEGFDDNGVIFSNSWDESLISALEDLEYLRMCTLRPLMPLKMSSATHER